MLFTALFAAAIWWIGTGLVVLVVRRSELGIAALLQIIVLVNVSFFGLAFSASDATASGAFIAFVSAVCLWGILELAHLLGWLTGPEKSACPDGVVGWSRFLRAVQVGLYHDLLIVAAAVALWVLVWNEPNKVSAYSFTVLWLMRWSAKLNLFLGVANFDSALVPERMQYMASYMRQRSLNPLFPVSVIIGCFAVWTFAVGALTHTSEHLQTSGMLLGTLAALGVLEHLLLMLPLRDSRLWRWAMPADS